MHASAAADASLSCCKGRRRSVLLRQHVIHKDGHCKESAGREWRLLERQGLHELGRLQWCAHHERLAALRTGMNAGPYELSSAPKQQQGGDLKQADRPHTASSKAHLRRWQR